MPIIDTTYSIEVTTSVNQPTTLLLEIPNVMKENVIWLKDGDPATHTMLNDGSLYISNTALSDQGEYTAMVTEDDHTSSKVYTLFVIEPKMPLGLPCVLLMINIIIYFRCQC